MHKSLGLFALLLVGASFSVSGRVARVSEGNLIVKLKKDIKSISFVRNHLSGMGTRIEKSLIPEMGIYLIKADQSIGLQGSISELKSTGLFEYVQYDHLITPRMIPNDVNFKDMWNFNVQNNGADISAGKAWDQSVGGKDARGNDIVVAVVDGGVDFNHRDLVDNFWTNKNEIAGNGIDDDKNGYIDDVYGWNAYTKNGSIPSSRHGTHVAGIIGAKGNNGKDVAGVNWNVKLMTVAASSGTTSVVLEGYGYVLKQKKLFIESNGAKGANVVSTNSSFGVDYADCESNDYPVWNDIYNEMGKYGILSAAATINGNVDVDANGDVPTGCSSPYLVTVTNTDVTNSKYSSAGYGADSIDLGAPGTNVLSTLPSNTIGALTGTSMATPHVAGAIALVHAAAKKSLNDQYYSNPAETALFFKQVLLDTTTANNSLKGKTVTGGKLNLANAVNAVK